jgi:hypothetical protein
MNGRGHQGKYVNKEEKMASDRPEEQQHFRVEILKKKNLWRLSSSQGN